MKKSLLTLILLLLLFSCKKEKYQRGLYEFKKTFTYNWDSTGTEYESIRDIYILSETKTSIEFAYVSNYSGNFYGKTFLEKKGNRISGDFLPDSPESLYIEGYKVPFSSAITGEFSALEYVYQGSGPILTVEYEGTFTMIGKKQ